MPARKPGAPAKKAGRPKGSKNKETKLKELALKRILMGHKTPLDFLLNAMMSDELDFEQRRSCAVAAAPYVHRKMPIAIENSDKGPFRVLDEKQLGNLTESELLTLRALLLKAEPALGDGAVEHAG